MNSSSRDLSPPYYAVIFTAHRKTESQEYADSAKKLKELAEEIAGYLGIESVEQNDGSEITVSYWKTRDAIRQWREHQGHKQAQEKGRAEWYDEYHVQIAKVEANYGFDSQPG